MTIEILNQEEIFTKYQNLKKESSFDTYTENASASLSAYSQYPNLHNLFNVIFYDTRIDTKERDLLLTQTMALIITHLSPSSISINDKIEIVKSNQLNKNDVFIWCNTLSLCTDKFDDSTILIADIYYYFEIGEESLISHKEVDQQTVFRIGTFKNKD